MFLVMLEYIKYKLLETVYYKGRFYVFIQLCDAKNKRMATGNPEAFWPNWIFRFALELFLL